MKSEFPERRQNNEAFAGAIVDIAVLKTKFASIEDQIEKGFNNTEELIWSIKNDFKTMYLELKTDSKIHEAKDEISRGDIADIKSKYKTGKLMLFAAGVGAILVSKGFDGAVKLLGTFFGV